MRCNIPSVRELWQRRIQSEGKESAEICDSKDSYEIYIGNYFHLEKFQAQLMSHWNV